MAAAEADSAGAAVQDIAEKIAAEIESKPADAEEPEKRINVASVIKMDVGALTQHDRREFYKNYLLYASMGETMETPFGESQRV